MFLFFSTGLAIYSLTLRFWRYVSWDLKYQMAINDVLLSSKYRELFGTTEDKGFSDLFLMPYLNLSFWNSLPSFGNGPRVSRNADHHSVRKFLANQFLTKEDMKKMFFHRLIFDAIYNFESSLPLQIQKWSSFKGHENKAYLLVRVLHVITFF